MYLEARLINIARGGLVVINVVRARHGVIECFDVGIIHIVALVARPIIEIRVRRSGSIGQTGRPVQPSPDARLRLILAHPERPFGRLDLVTDAPARDKRTGDGWIGEVDRDRILQHAARSGRCAPSHPRRSSSSSQAVASVCRCPIVGSSDIMA